MSQHPFVVTFYLSLTTLKPSGMLSPHFPSQILILEIIEKSLYSAFPAIHVHQGDQAQEVWNNGQDADVMFFWYIQTFLNECATSSP